jgi:hypothetical protein
VKGIANHCQNTKRSKSPPGPPGPLSELHTCDNMLLLAQGAHEECLRLQKDDIELW